MLRAKLPRHSALSSQLREAVICSAPVARAMTHNNSTMENRNQKGKF
jgi:hypothetical protein